MSAEVTQGEEVAALRQSVAHMQRDMELRFSRLEALLLASSGSPSTHDQQKDNRRECDTPAKQNAGYVPKPKLEPPKCDGSDPLRWLYKVQEYFQFYDTPPEERLRCVALMLEGAAADWFPWRRTNNLLAGWEDFVDKFKLRFDSQHYVDYLGQLAKLRQRGTVMEYQGEFEKLLQHVTGAGEDILISLFHAGLRSHLQQEIGLLKPETLSDSFALARELEAKHTALVSAISQRPYGGSSYTPSRGTGPGLRAAPTTPLLPTPTKALAESKMPYTIRRLTRAERLEKGLCYNCDQKWSRTHSCGRFLLLCDDDPGDVDDPGPTPDELVVEADISSLNNFMGLTAPRSLRLPGRIGSKEVRVLIDGGSTHNFIHPEVVTRLQLPMPCTAQCLAVQLFLQDTAFVVDLYILSIHGQDLVLGVQWLQQLGKVAQDFAQLTMEFTWDGKVITLQGSSPTPKPVSLAMFQTMQSHEAILECYELLALTPEDSPTAAAKPRELALCPAIAEVLHNYAEVTVRFKIVISWLSKL
ncbi:unnamed protein product [Cuscuta campestris]|uniref:Retrotransposon gag domain-containing protein n=1 Tax=Cuscuta campestris TaxID=132261 RepID=A0A484LM32_9ASTE|nr:unnamed protein product [Cuscuta campestris]